MPVETQRRRPEEPVDGAEGAAFETPGEMPKTVPSDPVGAVTNGPDRVVAPDKSDGEPRVMQQTDRKGPTLAATSAAAPPLRSQRTVKSSIDCVGIGLHSGARATLTLRPAPVDHGIVFFRTDLAEADRAIPATFDRVVDTRLCTVLGNDRGATVGTVEHLMAALAGSGITNVAVDIDGPEVPIMDGSSAEFLFLIDCAGTADQDAPMRAIEILKPVTVETDSGSARLEPADGIEIAFSIDFDASVIGRQEGSLTLLNGAFRSTVSRARTFGFLHEVEKLRSIGLARGGSLENAIVVDRDRDIVLNPEGLRYDDEFVRHKVLDAVGDLALAGAPIVGRYVGRRAGHAITNELLRALFAQPDAWRYTTIREPAPGAHGGWHAGAMADEPARLNRIA